jgi:hypothetical protein
MESKVPIIPLVVVFISVVVAILFATAYAELMSTTGSEWTTVEPTEQRVEFVDREPWKCVFVDGGPLMCRGIVPHQSKDNGWEMREAFVSCPIQ